MGFDSSYGVRIDRIDRDLDRDAECSGLVLDMGWNAVGIG